MCDAPRSVSLDASLLVELGSVADESALRQFLAVRLLYPSNPLQGREPEEQYAEEYSIAGQLGFERSLFSFEGFMADEFRMIPSPSRSELILYRGWMMKPPHYTELHRTLIGLGAVPLTTPQQYQLCHYLPEWYEILKELTSETRFFDENDDMVAELQRLGWKGCFLKDYVKSVSAEGGGMARELDQIPTVIARMKKFRGEIEGGICARRIEDFEAGSEERHFVFRGKAFSRTGSAPAMVATAAERIASPFFSVDTAVRTDGVIRIVELGDGQVSDLKQWPAQRFLELLRENVADT